MYITFIRPLLEYASEVWDGCTQSDIEQLEKVQLHAARIVTGLPIFSSRESLYYETGWEPLSSRRHSKKLTVMYKIHNNLVPDYLKQIFPSTRGSLSRYNTRNTSDYSIPKCRLQVFKKSFVPDVINHWNLLQIEAREATSLTIFKKHINRNIPKPPNYFSAGNRKINIIHTKLRHNCILNNDLFRRNIIGSPLCSCGQVENSYHFFFSCPLYKQARNRLFNELLKIDQTNIIDTHLLLWGNEALPESLNKIIFAHVHNYIRDSSRFN